MNSRPSGEYRTLRVIRGEGPRRSGATRVDRRRLALRRVDRETHGLVVMVPTEDVPLRFADWWFDLRRGRLRIYGALLRCIDVLHEAKVPKQVVLMIPAWIAAYIDDLYDDRPKGDAVRVA